MAIETPHYTVIRKDGPIEQRTYESYIVASVDITAENYSAASNRAFGILADYIFGNNTAHNAFGSAVSHDTNVSEKIAMTAPVTASKNGRNTYEVCFTMPSRYTMQTLPRPNSPAVHVRELPAHEAVVIRFSGLVSESKVAEMTRKLRSWASSQDIMINDTAHILRYDPPWKPGFIRRNEVLFNLL